MINFRLLKMFSSRNVRLFCVITLIVLLGTNLRVGQRQQKSSSETHSNFNSAIKPTLYCLPEDKLDQTNPCLINYVRKALIPPSGLPLKMPAVITYNRLAPHAAEERTSFIEKHLIQKQRPSTQGFFIEAGANNGEFLSNTLELELKHNWTGLLIEPNPDLFPELVAMHRNAWSLNQAICTTTHSDKVRFHVNKARPGAGSLINETSHNVDFWVPCVPFYTMLLALNITSVDFLSLDIQGIELDVLKTVPLDKVIFKIMVLEHNMVPGFQPAFIAFLEKREYKFIGSQLDLHTVDSLFVHQTIYTPDMALRMKYHNMKRRGWAV